MAKITAATPKGTRDFSPDELAKRNYIFNTIKAVYEKFGYRQLETPTMENLDTLTGKYGEEGDRLIFKILDSGDFLKNERKIKKPLDEYTSTQLAFAISDKALRYDLTVPFARYVVQHRNDIKFPFKRYQIQPVWRADKPQKGRYREFYQCDADVVGSDSLWNEVELILIFDEVLSSLKLPGFSIKINNRKILAGLAEVTGVGENLPSFLIALDKLDKIGREKVLEELLTRGFDQTVAEDALNLACAEGDAETTLTLLRERFVTSEIGRKGLEELEFVLLQSKAAGLQKAALEFDLSLARGIEYYTGAIFEVKAHGVQMGSICGGGRYDNLTGIFGLNGVSGVGISFGADRIYDVLEELKLFPESVTQSIKILFMNFGEQETAFSLKLAQKLRAKGISCELYPDKVKIQKQFEHAESKGIQWVCTVGSNEVENNQVQIKNMFTKEQRVISVEEFLVFNF
jgi:histidyl-tRNA synthetase